MSRFFECSLGGIATTGISAGQPTARRGYTAMRDVDGQQQHRSLFHNSRVDRRPARQIDRHIDRQLERCHTEWRVAERHECLPITGGLGKKGKGGVSDLL